MMYHDIENLPYIAGLLLFCVVPLLIALTSSIHKRRVRYRTYREVRAKLEGPGAAP